LWCKQCRRCPHNKIPIKYLHRSVTIRSRLAVCFIILEYPVNSIFSRPDVSQSLSNSSDSFLRVIKVIERSQYIFATYFCAAPWICIEAQVASSSLFDDFITKTIACNNFPTRTNQKCFVIGAYQILYQQSSRFRHKTNP